MSASESARVVVTGLGVVTALGLDESTFWTSLMAGRSGIRRLSSLHTADLRTTVGSEIPQAELLAALQTRGISPSDRTLDLTLLAAVQALEQAGIVTGPPPYAPSEVATILGTGAGPSYSLYESYMAFAAKGVRGVRPTTVPRCMANALSAHTSLRFRLTGPNYVVVCACASATTAIGIGFRMVRDGHAERVLCGGADAVFDPATFAAWNNLGVMSRNPDPLRACRPFDAERDGCVLGEGAGALVLESLAGARRRRAAVRAEICGYGETSDAEHITRPSVEGQARAIRAALRSAELAPGDVGFINAHGTATRANDECESRTIREVFGDAADHIPVASNKSFYGHLLGASGAVETVAAILGLERRRVPANLNLDRPDPACNLRLVGPQPLALDAPVVMKNSFGFGGNNAVLVLRRWDE
jgi:3-oxoacyl-[acyl-carrier-protein] synthase II